MSCATSPLSSVCRNAAGLMWVWDLPATLGWSAGGSPGDARLKSSTSKSWGVRMNFGIGCTTDIKILNALHQGILEQDSIGSNHVT